MSAAFANAGVTIPDQPDDPSSGLPLAEGDAWLVVIAKTVDSAVTLAEPSGWVLRAHWVAE